MGHWAHTKEQKRKDRWEAFWTYLGIFAFMVLLLVVMGSCPAPGP